MYRNHLRSFLVVLKTIPRLPLLYRDARKVRKLIPDLPEAHTDSGISGSAESRPFRVVILGESTMSGVGVTRHADGFAGAFAEEMSILLRRPVHWTVHAKSGFNVRRVREELVPKLSMEPIDLIVVGLGGNDAFELRSPWQWRSDVRILIAAIRKNFKRVPIVFANMPPIRDFPAFTGLMQYLLGGWVEMLGAVLSDEVALHEGVYYDARIIRLEDWIANSNKPLKSEDFFSDGVHPSQLTYRIWGSEMARFTVRQLNATKLNTM